MNSAAWPETHTLHEDQESSWAAQERKERNIPPPFEKHNYASEKRKVREKAY